MVPPAPHPPPTIFRASFAQNAAAGPPAPCTRPSRPGAPGRPPRVRPAWPLRRLARVGVSPGWASCLLWCQACSVGRVGVRPAWPLRRLACPTLRPFPDARPSPSGGPVGRLARSGARLARLARSPALVFSPLGRSGAWPARAGLPAAPGRPPPRFARPARAPASAGPPPRAGRVPGLPRGGRPSRVGGVPGSPRAGRLPRSPGVGRVPAHLAEAAHLGDVAHWGGCGGSPRRPSVRRRSRAGSRTRRATSRSLPCRGGSGRRTGEESRLARYSRRSCSGSATGRLGAERAGGGRRRATAGVARPTPWRSASSRTRPMTRCWYAFGA